MNKPFGIRGSLQPPIKDIENKFNFDAFSISIKDGVFEIGFDNAEDEEQARILVRQLLDSWSFRNNHKIEVNLNQKWKPLPEGKRHIEIELHEHIGISDRVMTTVISERMAYVVVQSEDSYHFSNDIEMVRKASSNEALASALSFYSGEVLESQRPLYGLYKAIEVMSREVGGDSQLASLINQPKRFVEDIKQTAQPTRHAYTPANEKLTESECRERVRRLLGAFADSINI